MLGMMSLVLASLLQASSDASACSMSTGYAPFEISRDAQPLDAPQDALGAPKAEVLSITRGIGGAPGSCDAQSIMLISVKPRGGNYKAEDLGFELSVVGDEAIRRVFPSRIVAIDPNNTRNELLLLWSDDAPAQQRPLQFDIQVRAITHGYLRGPATVLHIDTRPSDVIKAEAKAAKQAGKEQHKLAREQDGN